MTNNILISQPHGLGDYIFSNSIANDFIDEGYKVFWPVESVYATVTKHFPGIFMIDKSLVNINLNLPMDYVVNDIRVVPLRFSDSLMGVPYTQCMSAKYDFLGKDWTKWKDNCKISRSWEREHVLISHLNITTGFDFNKPYNLISEHFTTGGARIDKIMPPDNGLPNLYMTLIPGFTLIDWMTIIENATEIHAISSANIYLFELYMDKIKAKEGNNIHLYVRRPNEQNHDNYRYILSPTGYTFMP